MTAAGAFLAYFFPLVWQGPQVCQIDNRIADSRKDPTILVFKSIFEINKITDGVACEAGCHLENFNGFVNIVQSPDQCMSNSSVSTPGSPYYCPCSGPRKVNATDSACAGDTFRLSSGTNGFLEIFQYNSELKQFLWYPYCIKSNDVPVNVTDDGSGKASGDDSDSGIYGDQAEDTMNDGKEGSIDGSEDYHDLSNAKATESSWKEVEPARVAIEQANVRAFAHDQNLAKAVCRSLGMEFDNFTGFNLGIESFYKKEVLFYPYKIKCNGSEDHLRDCHFEFSHASSSQSCERQGGQPFQLMCTEKGRTPNVARYITSKDPAISSRFEFFEGSVGRWVSISQLGWTPIESDAACKQVGRVDLYGAKRLWSCRQHFEHFNSLGTTAGTGTYLVVLDGANLPVYCDMDTEDPGWTLIFNNTFQKPWSLENAKMRNMFNHSLFEDYSVLSMVDLITHRFPGEYVDIRIDVDAVRNNGKAGIFRIFKNQSLVSSYPSGHIWPKDVDPLFMKKLLSTHSDSDRRSWFGLTVPHFSNSSDGFSLYSMTNSTYSWQKAGNLITRRPERNDENLFFPQDPKPRFISMWVREGTEQNQTDGTCTDHVYLFETRTFSKRQIFASSSRRAKTGPAQSTFRGLGWTWQVGDNEPWIQVDLINECVVTALVVMFEFNATEALDATLTLEYKSRWSGEAWTDLILDEKDDMEFESREFYSFHLRDYHPNNSMIHGRLFRLNILKRNAKFTIPVSVRWTLFGCMLKKDGLLQYIELEGKIYRLPLEGARRDTPMSEEEVFGEDNSNCKISSMEIRLQKFIMVEAFIISLPPFRPRESSLMIMDIRVYLSADGSHENLQNHYRKPTRDPMDKLALQEDFEPIYVEKEQIPIVARLLQFAFKETCPFRVEIIGRTADPVCSDLIDITKKPVKVTYSAKDNNEFFGYKETLLHTVLTKKGNGVWVPHDRDPEKVMIIDLLFMHTITAIIVQGYGDRTVEEIRLYSAMVKDSWQFCCSFTMETRLSMQPEYFSLVPPIIQARFIKVQMVVGNGMKFQLAGCKVPYSKSMYFPRIDILRKTELVQLDKEGEQRNTTTCSLRKCYEEMKRLKRHHDGYGHSFGYGPKKRVCVQYLSPTNPRAIGYRRHEDIDFYYESQEKEPLWTTPPLISHFKCNRSEVTLEQCHYLEGQENPQDHSSPVVPTCSVYCGDPGDVSCASARGYDYRHSADNSTVVYECEYDGSADPTLPQPVACTDTGNWSPSAVFCARYVDTDAAADRPIYTSSLSYSDTAMAQAWYPADGHWSRDKLRCKGTMRETYPRVWIDLEYAMEVHTVQLDFGIGRDLKNAELRIYVTNSLNMVYSSADLCENDPEHNQTSNNLKWKCRYAVTGRYVMVEVLHAETINLYMCAMHVVGITCAPQRNLAFSKKTWQNSLPIATVKGANFFSYLAVDGNSTVESNVMGQYEQSTCAMTSEGGTAWWVVDLQQESAVSSLTLYMKTSQITDTAGLNISVTNSVNDTSLHRSCMYGNQETIDFDHVMDPEIGRIVIQCRTKLYGRYVQIARTGSTGSLSLCEVKVWGRNCAEEINRAVQKPVQYSSLTRSSSVMFLTDGGGKSNFETALEDQPYVIVDLTAAYFIDAFFVEAGKVSMYNLNISTSVSRNMSSFQAVYTIPALEKFKEIRVNYSSFRNAKSSTPVFARFIKFSLQRQGVLSFSQIRIISFGCVGNPMSVSSYRNLAFRMGKDLSISRESESEYITKKDVTVDGMKIALPTMCYETAPTRKNEWKLTLAAKSRIFRITIYGTITVPMAARVDGKLCGSLVPLSLNMLHYVITCSLDSTQTIGVVGREISIVTDTKIPKAIILCEVEVWGTTKSGPFGPKLVGKFGGDFNVEVVKT